MTFTAEQEEQIIYAAEDLWGSWEPTADDPTPPTARDIIDGLQSSDGIDHGARRELLAEAQKRLADRNLPIITSLEES